ncbi:dihydrolipoyl dehydrogenase [Heyndrickxia acidicola]|uniref:Dihydrolipoyl dehydrogenase n=1 Tax=Heyndrickxia acidicola TaxID=209389 RepID=A0ABU6MHQ1_9BACI|nr:dihydrolipoyl dehydrogenase [Heyndrickxia acidicola]MED1204199.1 dihydrolipoyl dehydrogenase [Heyndrickxia acidicola]
MKKRVIIIGGGPGGYTAALHATRLGAEVTLIEKNVLGGTCLNTGCIPTKSLLESSYTWHKGRLMFPEKMKGDVPWKSMFSQKEAAVLKLRKGVEGLLRTGEINVVKGTASLLPNKQVMVVGEEKRLIEGDAIILATGSRPIVPTIEGIDLPEVGTSDDFLSLTELPKEVAIIGGGVIGIEFATIFAELGLDVHVIEATERILPMMDSDISKSLTRQLSEKGVHFYLENRVEKIAKKEQGKVELTLSGGYVVEAERVLAAVGRKAVLEELNLDHAGILQSGNKIQVNAYQETSIEGIYAIGDCASPIMLAHVAMAEGKVAVEHALGMKTEPVIYDFVPQCTYSHPEAAMVGITSEEAAFRGFDYEEHVFSMKASGMALIEGENTGFIKIVAEKNYGRVLGVHLLCPNATEMISHATLALTLESTIDELANMIYPHPSIVEGIQEALPLTNE